MVVTRTLIWKTENESLQHTLQVTLPSYKNQHLPTARDQLPSLQEFHCQQLQTHLPCQHSISSLSVEYSFLVLQCLSSLFLLIFPSIHWHMSEPFTAYEFDFLGWNILHFLTILALDVRSWMVFQKKHYMTHCLDRKVSFHMWKHAGESDKGLQQGSLQFQLTEAGRHLYIFHQQFSWSKLNSTGISPQRLV